MRTDEPSYVFALDKNTGKTLWKVERPTDAQMESPDSYETPQMARVAGQLQLVISGADCVTGHEPGIGKELWRMRGFYPTNNPAIRTIASSLVIGENVFVSSSRGRPFIGFRPENSGNITGKNELWTNSMGSDVPTHTTDGKYIYILGDSGIITGSKLQLERSYIRECASKTEHIAHRPYWPTAQSTALAKTAQPRL